jgi:uncharacterized protein
MKWFGSVRKRLRNTLRTRTADPGYAIRDTGCGIKFAVRIAYPGSRIPHPMFPQTIHIVRLIPLLLICIIMDSCASYNQQAADYYYHLQRGNYSKASAALDKTKLLKKQRNRLLYLLEKGKLCHLMQQWDSSNNYFNQADHLIEDGRTTAKDIALGTLMNPMMQSYQAEAFEKYLVHYYKALNYLQLHEPEEALVEARRISLQVQAQEDKNIAANKYSSDAFSLMLQGLIYEKNNDVNNAFIAYRNAADVYLKNNGRYYGTEMPDQLKKDLLRTASQNGFIDELQRYEKLLNTTYTKEETTEGGELIIFWENGSAPVKEQQDIYFSLFKNASNGFFFSDANGLYNVPYDMSNGYNRDNIKLEDLRSFRVALPKYKQQPLTHSGASIQAGSNTYTLEAVENINTLATSTLQERLLKELSSSLTRLAVKKLTEAAIRPNEKKDDNDKNKSEEEKKKEEKKRNQREALALGLQLFNFASEKADTRNWQSLPHTIYYTRLPLKKGENNFTLQLNGPSTPSYTVSATGNGDMQFRNICTIK